MAEKKVLLVGGFEALDRAVLEDEYSVDGDTGDAEAFASLINSEMDDYRDSGALAHGYVEILGVADEGAEGGGRQFVLAVFSEGEDSVLFPPSYCVLNITQGVARRLLKRMDIAATLREALFGPDFRHFAVASGLPEFVRAVGRVHEVCGQEMGDGPPAVPAGSELTDDEIAEAQEDMSLEGEEARFTDSYVVFRAIEEHTGVEFRSGELYRRQLEEIAQGAQAAAAS